jgi:hypothetical protein
MLKFILQYVIVFSIFLLCVAGKCNGQEYFAPYFGVSGSLDTKGDPGWGIEAGIHFRPFYVGLEYGTYSYRIPMSETEDLTPGGVASPSPISTEQFWGVHAGYVLESKYYLGLVILESNQIWGRGDTIAGWVTFTNYYLNIGPDFRYSGIDDGHIYLAFALTIRRGLKAGIGYMF